MSKLDIVIFGATGYTGKFIIKELASTFKNEKFSWAIAGRCEKKLKELLTNVSLETNSDLNSIEKFIVNVDDAESINKMCQRARILINCVGPYRFYGEQIIKQCLLTQTHHLDVSGEPEFLERMQLNYDKEAKEKNIFIIGSCGFDSVPADLGVIFTRNSFKNDLNYIESFLTIEGDGPVYFNYATWVSAVYGISASKNLGKIRKNLFKSALPKPNFSAPKRINFFGFFYDDLLKKYCFNFMGSDKSVVQRSQYFAYENNNTKPVQYLPYITIKNFSNSLLMIFFGLTFSFLSNYKFGRYLLLKYYNKFSFGLAKKADKPPSNIDTIKFTMQMRGVGSGENKQVPDKLIITEVRGPDLLEPGYITTSRLVICCALTLLQEQNKIPVKGGVLTPAGAFANTSLIEKLQNAGIKFDVVYQGVKTIENSKTKSNKIDFIPKSSYSKV